MTKAIYPKPVALQKLKTETDVIPESSNNDDSSSAKTPIRGSVKGIFIAYISSTRFNVF